MISLQGMAYNGLVLSLIFCILMKCQFFLVMRYSIDVTESMVKREQDHIYSTTDPDQYPL